MSEKTEDMKPEEKPVWKETPKFEPGAWNPTPEQRQEWEDYKEKLWAQILLNSDTTSDAAIIEKMQNMEIRRSPQPRHMTDAEIDRDKESTPPQEGEPRSWNPTPRQRQATKARLRDFLRPEPSSRKRKTSSGMSEESSG